VAFEDHIEVLLDEALEATFPASDPLALMVASERWRAEQEPRAKASRCGSDK
jgi:hypothetical protein